MSVGLTDHNPSAAKALASAIAQSKRPDGAPLREQQSGRLDRGRLAQVAVGNRRVFLRPGAPAPKKLRVLILLDASGSMGGGIDTKGSGHLMTSRPYSGPMSKYNASRSGIARMMMRFELAGQAARDLADATEMMPNVKAEVWAHTQRSISPEVYKLWASGEPTVRIDRYADIEMSGNVDGSALAYCVDELAGELQSDEVGLIFMVSDGSPAYTEGAEFGIAHTRRVVADAKKKRIHTVSVAIAGDLDFSVQIAMYGKDAAIPFDGNVNAFARNMAKAIGHAMG